MMYIIYIYETKSACHKDFLAASPTCLAAPLKGERAAIWSLSVLLVVFGVAVACPVVVLSCVCARVSGTRRSRRSVVN